MGGGFGGATQRGATPAPRAGPEPGREERSAPLPARDGASARRFGHRSGVARSVLLPPTPTASSRLPRRVAGPGAARSPRCQPASWRFSSKPALWRGGFGSPGVPAPGGGRCGGPGRLFQTRLIFTALRKAHHAASALLGKHMLRPGWAGLRRPGSAGCWGEAGPARALLPCPGQHRDSAAPRGPAGFSFPHFQLGSRAGCLRSFLPRRRRRRSLPGTGTPGWSSSKESQEHV